MAVFFRVEDENGWGMYSSPKALTITSIWVARGDEPADSVRRPTTVEESVDHGRPLLMQVSLPNRRFAFKHLWQMAEWLGSLNTLDKLIERGFKIGVYYVADHSAYAVGKCQVKFDHARATRTGELRLDTIRAAVTLENNDDA